MYSHHSERHFSDRNNWLRASVLGANDGLISTASLLTGVAAAAPDFQTLLLTGVSALIGGAVSMAAGGVRFRVQPIGYGKSRFAQRMLRIGK